MSRWILAGFFPLFGCAPDVERIELELLDRSCAGGTSEVSSVAVEVYGVDSGELCILARRCVAVDEPADLEAVSEALRSTAQPLIDIEHADAMQIAVLGHEHPGCGRGDRLFCGFEDIAAAVDGVLTVAVECVRDNAACGSEEGRFCPP